jgi:isopentenyl-diphosphate Delta-isomerase
MPAPMGVEHIDVLDRAGTPLHHIATRAEVHRKGLWHRTVHIWVLNRNNELLLQKRAGNKETFPGLWDISAAGHISAGDTSINAALRELEEELGIRARKGSLKLLFTITGHYKDSSRPFIDNEISDVYLLRDDIQIKSIAVDKDEVDEAKYMAVDELKRELESHPELYVPHHEAYGKLFQYLESVR